MFYALHRITGESLYWDWLDMLTQDVTESSSHIAIPAHGNYFCQCCGRAGLTDYFVGLWDTTSDGRYLTLANQIGESMLELWRWKRDGNQWLPLSPVVPQPLHPMESGFSLGVSGVGLSFLNLSAANQGSNLRFALPDNPFFKRM